MDGNRFDELTRVLGSGRSRRGVLKGLGTAALGAAGLSRLGTTEAKNGGFDNTACVNFCNAAFQKGRARYECQQAGAHGSGPCAACGANIANYCHGTCTDVSTDVNNCGACGNVCVQPTNGSATCSGGGCGVTCNYGYQSDGASGCVAATCPPCGPVGHSACFWLNCFSFNGACCWAEQPGVDQGTCQYLDSCNGGGGGSGGGCYKWDTTTC